MEVNIERGAAPSWPASSGYGDGYGDGYGGGYGYGYGSGGYGDGDGYGSGSGGYGGGGGDGYGDGYGYGDGSGSGSGDGDGYGSPKYWLATIPHFAAKWPPEQRARLTVLQKAGATIAFWRSDANGRPCNGGKGEAVKPGTIETLPGPLQLCAKGTLHATLNPAKWEGERWWIVALTGEVVSDEDKMGALAREVIGECL